MPKSDQPKILIKLTEKGKRAVEEAKRRAALSGQPVECHFLEIMEEWKHIKADAKELNLQ